MRKSRESSRAGATYNDPSGFRKNPLLKKTLESLVNQYLVYKRGSNTAKTMRTREGRVMQPLRPLLGLLPREVDAATLAGTLMEWCEGKAPSTARSGIQECKSFWVWLAEEELISGQPWDHKLLKRLPKAFPKRKRVRPQFRIDEAATLYQYLLGVADSDPAAMVALLCLTAGFRLGEVLGLQARNVDAGGSIVWVSGKTDAADRQVEIPSPVVPLLLHHKRDLKGLTLVFPFTSDQVRPRIKRHYEAAGVPVLDVHALRRTNSTLRIVGGQSPNVVIGALGHTSFEMTKGHYLAPGTVENEGQKNVGKLLKFR